MVYKRKTRTYFLHMSALENPFLIAKKLRKRQTRAEIILWNHLKSRKCGGFKFRRQHPLLHYIADFYCHEQRLVIEVDGNIHLKKDVYDKDQNRTAELERIGIRVLRFTNDDVSDCVEKVLNTIISFIRTNPYNN